MPLCWDAYGSARPFNDDVALRQGFRPTEPSKGQNTKRGQTGSNVFHNLHKYITSK